MDVKDILAKVDKDKLRKALSEDDPNELRELMEQEGIDITDEQLDYIAGGMSIEYPWETC